MRNKLAVILAAAVSLATLAAHAAGTWTPLNHQTPNISPNGNPSLMLLLSDGTVMVENDPTGGGGSNWFRLSPDAQGHYVNGTWTQLASMHYTRAGCASQVMTNGQVFFAGGEYGTGYATAEVYDPVSNVWTVLNVPSNLINTTNGNGFSDATSIMLGNGEVMVAPVSVAYSGETILFNPVGNVLSAGPNLKTHNQDEAGWVKLPDNSILTAGPFTTNSSRYVPAVNAWVNDANVPVVLYDSLGEIGPGFLLPNGKAFYPGGTGHTAIYTPSGSLAAGTWVAGPDLPVVGTNQQGTSDAPACMMPNGKILLGTGVSGTYNGPIYFWEYNYLSNTFTAAPSPSGGASFSAAPYYTKMLPLPDGNVLWNVGSPQLYVYTPDGTPLTNGQPIISNIVQNLDGSFTLSGFLLNGISCGAAYGDDAQMDSNYPIIRIRKGVFTYYARSYNWTSTSVQATNKLVSTQFVLPAGAAPGTYTLSVIANGNASATVPFTFPLVPPVVSSVAVSGADVVINASSGLAGRTYIAYMSTDVTQPLSSWTPVATNFLAATGSFSVTASNTFSPGSPQEYFILNAH